MTITEESNIDFVPDDIIITYDDGSEIRMSVVKPVDCRIWCSCD